jgi:hypothetical protein
MLKQDSCNIEPAALTGAPSQWDALRQAVNIPQILELNFNQFTSVESERQIR